MLVVAINQIGTVVDNNFESGFLKRFNDFQTIKLSCSEVVTEKQLQICQPEKEEQMVREVMESLDPDGPLVELSGARDKVQKVIRSMVFPGREKKYEKVLLTGGDGITDFPWAVQIVLAHPPATGLEQNLEWAPKADLIVLYGFKEEEGEKFTAGLKTINPNIPVHLEKAGQDLSKDLKDSLEALFDAYLEKRKRIKDKLEEQMQQLISCELAHRMAGELKVGIDLFGSVCDESGYRITRCRLGCF